MREKRVAEIVSGILLGLFPLGLLAQTVEEGVRQFQHGKWSEAKRTFESILQKDEKSADAHYWLGLLLTRPDFKNEDAAVEHMERAVELNPANADYHYGLGAAYGTQAQSASILKQVFIAPKVKREFERAVELNPRHLQAHMGLAEYYRQAPGIMGGDADKAWKEADAIIALDEIAGRTFKARLFERDKKFAEAESELKTMVTNQPKDWRSWRNMGLYYLRIQKSDEALAAFNKYVELRPDTADAYARLGQAYVLKKDAERAIAVSKKALAMDKELTTAVWNLAQAYEMKGQKKDARETYQFLFSNETNSDRKKSLEKKIKELQ